MSTTATPAKRNAETTPKSSTKKSCKSAAAPPPPPVPGMEVDLDEQENEDEVTGPPFEYLMLKQNVEYHGTGLDEGDLVAILTSVSTPDPAIWGIVSSECLRASINLGFQARHNYVKYNLEGEGPGVYTSIPNARAVATNKYTNVVCGAGWTGWLIKVKRESVPSWTLEFSEAVDSKEALLDFAAEHCRLNIPMLILQAVCFAAEVKLQQMGT
ncbi:hypothetical protein FRC06_005917 [Ceratobasidium sp. 370]|nr:hypothetical protein FRC06_005917 [Ceratobasidium sp. 370]